MRIQLLSAALCLLVASSCKQYKPVRSLQTQEKSADAGVGGTVGGSPDCKSKNVLAPKANSRVSWQVTKVVGTQEELINGSNSVSGYMEFKGEDLATATGKFVFDIPSTDSGDATRDERIETVIFGLGRKLGLSFDLKSLTGLTLNLPSAGASIDINAIGSFQIAGQTAELEIPLSLSEKEGVYRLISRGPTDLNVRSLKRAKNAFNLEKEIIQILNFVPGTNMREIVKLSMNIELVKGCP